MNIPSIFFFSPNRVRRSYKGGYCLDLLEEKKECVDSFYPEDWIASTIHAVNDNIQENEKNAGISEINLNGSSMLFTQLLEEYGDLILGEEHIAVYGKTIPFLQKFLDSAARLHFQIHPDIPFAQKHLNSNYGKSEGYLILSTRKEQDSYIYLGFRRVPSQEEFKRIIIDQDIAELEQLFNKIPVQSGDVFFIPGGLPHAIGAGLMVLEIMEPTDFTFLPEFTRDGVTLSERKKYMGLDLDTCLEAVDYTCYTPEEIKAKFMIEPYIEKTNQFFCVENLFPFSNSPFNAKKKKVFDNYEERACAIKWEICIVIKGKGEIYYDSEMIEIKAGDKFFVPCSSQGYVIKNLLDEAIEIVKITSNK